MKKLVALILALLSLLSIIGLSGCGNGMQQSKTPPTPEPSPTAREQLNEYETVLFDAIIKIEKEDFIEPSTVRVVELCDYQKNSIREENDKYFGPDTIVVRFQGDNGYSGIPYYKVVVVGAENETEEGKKKIAELEELYPLGKDLIMDYKGRAGEYIKLNSIATQYISSPSDYERRKIEEVFNVANINRALAEYWEEMGF